MAGPQPLATPPAALKPVAVQPQFTRLAKEGERKAFYKKLSEPKWWTGGWVKDSQHGWPEIYGKTDWMCIYCARDLAASTEALSESTQEHLVPRSLLEANGIEPNREHNLCACCAGCNTLKGEWLPPADHACWKNRKAYIKACKEFIARQRYEKFKELQGHVENALKRRAGV